MDVVAAPYLAGALLLVVAGVAKAVDPLSLVRALRAAGLRVRAPVLARVVRVLAGAALVLGVLVAGLLRSHAEILKALHDLGAGLELDRSEPVPVTIEGVRT